MIYILLNFGAIAAATLAGLIIGVAFLRLGSVRARPGVRLLLVAIVMEFWLASILAGALILAPPKGGEWTMAIGSAFVIWIGFVLPVLAVGHTARGQGARVVVADAAHWLAVMLAQAVVLKLIGLVPPPA
ncbi:hypothetical protein GO308_05740 [Sphingomonas sp. SFZ2018-12]|uniref:hypothetical protein n=1 Tax=Sphingomonas sp. SFZ2018-12 TaxID=2683197 RepID=UPI001F0F85F0|nr:hypothetical protein [Sphingomonas sp. SFZ2018-12]